MDKPLARNRYATPRIALLVLGCLWAAVPGRGQERRALDLDAVLQRTRFREVSISPDGFSAAAITYRPALNSSSSDCSLTVFALTEGTQVTEDLGPGQFGLLRWSRDSRRLSFLRWGVRFTEFWYYDCSLQTMFDRISGDHLQNVFRYFWRERDGAAEVLVLKSNGRDCTVEPLDLETHDLGAPIARIRSWFVKEAEISADGRVLAFTASRSGGAGPAGSALDLFLLDFGSAVTERLTQGGGIAGSPVFGPHREFLACTWIPDDRLFSTRKREILCFVPDEKRPRRLTSEWESSLGDGIYGINERLYASGDGRSVLTSTQSGMADHVLAFAVTDGQVRRLSAGDFSYKGFVHADGSPRGVSVQSGPTVPERMFLHDFESGTGAVLYDPNLELRRRMLARPEAVAFRGADHLVVEGLLLRPQAGTAPFPLLCILHGGSSGRHTLRFNDAFSQVFASLGYAVFLPNPRGSAGYRASFGEANVGDFGGKEVEDVALGIRHLIACGIVDPERVFLSGQSYGGFLVQMLLVRHPIARAGVSVSGVSDWVSFYEETDLPGLVVDGLGGTPEENLPRYRGSSPLHHADRIAAPLLLVHGARDRRVPIEQSRRMYDALHDRSATVKLVEFPDEGHAFQSSRSFRELISEAHRWFQHHGAGLP
jgi:dipeptidyl aminopeptidase/acylaminoacyl peptidase